MIYNFLKYTNGTGHLLMSIVGMVSGVMLLLFSNDPTTKAIGIGLIVSVQGAWFIPGSAKQVASEVAKQLQVPVEAVTSPLSNGETNATH